MLKQKKAGQKAGLASGAVLALMAILLSACFGGGAKQPKPKFYEITLDAASNTNPDDTGRPSPTLVKVITMKSDSAFQSADFFAIFESPEAALAADVIDVSVVTLTPGETHTVDIPTTDKNAFIGVIAGFQDLDRADWRDVAPFSQFKKQQARIQLSDKAVQFVYE